MQEFSTTKLVTVPERMTLPNEANKDNKFYTHTTEWLSPGSCLTYSFCLSSSEQLISTSNSNKPA